MVPFQRIRYQVLNGYTNLIPCSCKRCLFAERLGSDRPHFGLYKFKVRRLDFMCKEALEISFHGIHAHYTMVAQELAQPLTMGFTW